MRINNRIVEIEENEVIISTNHPDCKCYKITFEKGKEKYKIHNCKGIILEDYEPKKEVKQMVGTPVTKKTLSTAYTMLTLSFLTVLLRVFVWKNGWVAFGSWLMLLITFFVLLRGIKWEGY